MKLAQTPRNQIKLQGPILLVSIALVALILLFYAAQSVFKSLEINQATAKLSLYRTTIDNELRRLEHLPAIVADELHVKNAVQNIPSLALNQELADLSREARAEAIYVMNTTGLTIAASNFAETPNFLGKNYGFRRYFQDAIRGDRSSLFAIGATTSRPGYFLSAPILHLGDTVGVAVVKIDLTRLTSILEQTNESILVSNQDGIVVLSSKPEWRYRTIKKLSEERRSEIIQERQFGSELLNLLDWSVSKENTAVLQDREYLALQAQLYTPAWIVHYLGDVRPIRERALLVVAVAAGLMAISGLAFLTWRSGRLRRALSASQEDRKRLQREIEVRKKAEQNLNHAQEELKRSNKLAALGQLSASVTHELGQPISAMKNYLAAEEIAGGMPEDGVTKHLSSIVTRMENITKQLRFFSNDNAESMDIVSMQSVIHGALELLQHDLIDNEITLVKNLHRDEVFVYGNQQRLEQVVINLLRNAILAVDGMTEREIKITLAEDTAGIAVLSVSDTGSGLGGQTIDQLSEPFHTTRSSGEGMGLGLAISSSIIQEHDGRLTAKDVFTGGAEFMIELNARKKDQ
jgi:two-component system C4-dicarboxylate transport sensor histidine kinase DctB